ncbi:hypothetical protein [Microbacterium elymi]|uniref:Uncharacterized protein n=1 Tax=Microbacterium elymi TaxID=2909587 RepID=A0ABY5NMD4_9MICO|nr:hypothetical protein [Microbacterium elymi]UUT36343.1 hypothetical protein L2X98_25725 [Microbacterium elymi]
MFIQMWFATPLFAAIAWALIGIATLGVVGDAARHIGDGSPVRALDVLAVCWLVIPVGILVAASPVAPGFTARYGTYAAPAAAVLMASGIRRLARLRFGRRLAPIALLAVIAAAVPVWASQRTPFAKNQSDWNQIAQVIRTHARVGDAIVFDDGTRPSRRPRLAMDTDPTSFATVRDVTLASPYPDDPTWYDTTMSVDAAARHGRFHDVQRVWVVEYRVGRAVDTWGVDELRRLGYRERERVVDHRSVVALYTSAD